MMLNERGCVVLSVSASGECESCKQCEVRQILSERKNESQKVEPTPDLPKR